MVYAGGTPWRDDPYDFRRDPHVFAEPHPISRGRGHSRHAGGGRGVRATGAALLRRQGFLGPLAPGPEGVSSRPDPVPAAARRYRATSSPRCTSSATASCRRSAPICACIATRTALAAGANPWDLGTLKCCGFLKTRALLHRLEAPAVRRGHRAARGATRNDRAPRSGSSPSATSSASGIRRTSGRSCGICTTDGSTRARRIRIFPLSNWTELDVWRYIELESIPVVPLYFAPSARW